MSDTNDPERAAWVDDYGRYEDCEPAEWERDVDTAYVDMQQRIVLRDSGVAAEGAWITADTFASLDACE